MRLNAGVSGASEVKLVDYSGLRKRTTMNRGDVIELLPQGDFAGSLIQADRPIQVMSIHPCLFMPAAMSACDHIEEAMIPMEAVGSEYVIGLPAAPGTTAPVEHVVRFFGIDGRADLTFDPPLSGDSKCSTVLFEGDMTECSLSDDVHVRSTSRVGVAAFLEASSVVDPQGSLGDPAQYGLAAVEQYRTKCVFLAPSDYDFNYAVIAGPHEAVIDLDGARVTLTNAVGAGGMAVERVLLTKTPDEVHLLTSDVPVGVTVLGYGHSTSYAYAAGLDLRKLAAAPPIE